MTSRRILVDVRLSLLASVLVMTILVACSSQPPPADEVAPLEVDRLEVEVAPRYYVLHGARIRGDATVYVCDTASLSALVQDEGGSLTAEASRTGVRIRFRVPDLGLDTRSCSVVVEQPLGEDTERATLEQRLQYEPWLPLQDKQVLVYASIYDNDDQNPGDRFAEAVGSVAAEEDLLLTIVGAGRDETENEEVFETFVDQLTSAEWDAVVFIEEQWLVPTPLLDAVEEYLIERSGRVLGSYWATFEDGEFATDFGIPPGAYGEPARDYASAFGLTVTPRDNVVPVEGGRVDIDFAAPLAAGLTMGGFRLVNDYYRWSYANRLTPSQDSVSMCAFQDVDGGSCAVANATGTSLYFGFLFAPLSVGIGDQDLETLFKNALRYVILD